MIWDAVRYGFNTHLWLTIAGVPVVWGESASGKTLPSDFPTEDGSLSIDSSAEFGAEKIDRQRGIAAGLGLSFRLLDSDTTRDWLRSPSKTMTLTADQPASGAGSTAATVDDSTGWNNGDSMFLGMEAETIGVVAGATSLTGITRAEAGTLVYDHETGSTAQIITDRPRGFRGRDVILYASPIDPSGYITGADLAADAVEVWKGRISGSPRRERDGFAFEAVAFDRVLDQPLVGEVSGQIKDAIGKIAIQKGWKFSIAVDAVDVNGASLWTGGYDLVGFPFDADADGDMLSPGEIRDRISTEFAAAVTAASAGADIGGLVFGGPGKWPPASRIEIVIDANVYRVDVSITSDDILVPMESSQEFKGGMAGAVNAFVKTQWDGISPWPNDQSAPPGFDVNSVTIDSLTVKLDEGAPSDVSAPGVAKIGDKGTWKFSEAASSQGDLYLGGMQKISGAGLVGNDAAGKSISILFQDSGTPALAMLRALMSSGNGERSATYDTLQRGQGYGLAEASVNLASFTGGGAPFTDLPILISAADQSFADIFGGLLGMFRRAVVARPDLDDDHKIKLTLVRTSPYGSTYSATITDDDLLSADGDPIESVDAASVPNSVTVRRQTPGEDDEAADRFTFNDLASADTIGKVEAEFSIPTEDRETVKDLAEIVIPSLLAGDQMLQAVEIRLGPWVAAYPGDVVFFDGVTHPSLWTWNSSPAAVGYTGNGLVVGRRMSPTTSAVIATVLIDGQLSVRSLSPAMLVSAHAGTAANPTTLSVPLGLNDGYFNHLSQAIELAGGPIELYHYIPGDAEGAAESYTISAAAKSGGVCVLTVDVISGGHSVVVGESTLTLPTTLGGDLSTYQGTFAHVDDGSNWG